MYIYMATTIRTPRVALAGREPADFKSVRPVLSAMETRGTLADCPLMPTACEQLPDLVQCLTVRFLVFLEPFICMFRYPTPT